MEDEVEYYFSMIVGTKYVYFMLDHSFLPRDGFPKLTRLQSENAYMYYYGSLNLETDPQVMKCKHSLEPYSTKMLVKRL